MRRSKNFGGSDRVAEYEISKKTPFLSLVERLVLGPTRARATGKPRAAGKRSRGETEAGGKAEPELVGTEKSERFELPRRMPAEFSARSSLGARNSRNTVHRTAPPRPRSAGLATVMTWGTCSGHAKRQGTLCREADSKGRHDSGIRPWAALELERLYLRPGLLR